MVQPLQHPPSLISSSAWNGRQVGLKNQCSLWTCEFESRLEHQIVTLQRTHIEVKILGGWLELVDTRLLKSCKLNACVGSNPTPPTNFAASLTDSAGSSKPKQGGSIPPEATN